MKQMKLYKTLILTMIAGITTIGMVSCEKYNEWEVDKSYDRLFRPSELTADIDGVTATLKWRAKPNTGEYVVELSKDSLQFSQIVATYTGRPAKAADGYSFVIPDLLDPTTRYSARIKGVDTTGTSPESDWAGVTFVTKTEQIMLPVSAADLTKNSVTLKWNIPNQVSHFMINGVRYDITAGERTAGGKVITGLTPETSYSAVLYFNTSIRGSQNFKTNADLPTGDNVVLVKADDDLASLISNAQTGTMFVLLQGTKYFTDNAVTIPAGASITIWGQQGPKKPILAFNGINLLATAGTIKFENLDITGYQNDAGVTKRNYIFNLGGSSNPTNATDAIIFENCTIRNFANSAMRMQATTNPIIVNNFTVNKCIVNDIGAGGAYSFIHINTNPVNANVKINNISITGSTFSTIGYSLILHNTSPSASVVIENNTFYNVIGNTRYLIDYSAQTVGTFSFKNNIVGKTLSTAGTARGIRYSGSNLVATNNYKTNDAVFAGNAIPGISDYNKTSVDLFSDPDNGNFSIKDKTFEGISSSGDPRWRP